MPESRAEAGRTAVMSRGGGCAPMALSTATFRGKGKSKAKGVESKPSKKMQAICGQYGFASRSSRA